MSEPEMEHLEIPERPDGEFDFQVIARSILSRAWLHQAGDSLTIYGRLDIETTRGDFLAWYDSHGGVEVFEPCLGNKFAAGITMALQELAPASVRFRK